MEKNGSKKTVVIAICTLSEIQNVAYTSHLQFAYRLAKRNSDYEFLMFTPRRMTITNFRNAAAKAALEQEAEYLMFIDDDAVLTTEPDVFNRLKDRDKHIVSPVVYVRGYPFEPMFFKWTEDKDLKENEKGLDFYRDFKTCGKIQKNGLLEVGAIGCHCVLIKTEVFRALTYPYFITGMNNTEDVYFCMKCHDAIENIEIFVDTTFSIGHLIDPIFVDDGNVEYLRKFIEELAHNASLGREDLRGNVFAHEQKKKEREGGKKLDKGIEATLLKNQLNYAMKEEFEE